MALYSARPSISTQTARRIAGEWHGGQWSAMYSLCSTGHVGRDRLLKEIDQDLEGEDRPKERFRLRLLRAWVTRKTRTGG